MTFELPLLGIGTWQIGGGFARNETARSEGARAVEHALSLGYRLIDTAEIYGEGLAEEIVGEAIRGVPRHEIRIISKVYKNHLGPEEIRAALEGSLQRLKTEYLDLYLIHWPSDRGVPLADTMPALEALVREGVVRAIGVSNFSIEEMQEAARFLEQTPLAAHEMEYNILNQTARRELIPYCRNRSILPIAHRPLGKGAIARAYPATVDSLARKYGKTPVQVMLNWILSQGIPAVVKAASPAHLEENWGALGWRMETGDQALLLQE